MRDLEKWKIADFDQCDVMAPRAKNKRNAAATEGACHNFSIAWASLILRDANASAHSRMSALAKNNGNINPLLQKVFGDRWELEGARGAESLITQIHGVTCQDVFAYRSYNANEIIPNLKMRIGNAFIYSFWFNGHVKGAENGAHSVAFYATKHGDMLTLHFFDPNFGEFLLQENEFPTFWNFLTSMYGTVTGHWLRSSRLAKAIVLTGAFKPSKPSKPSKLSKLFKRR